MLKRELLAKIDDVKREIEELEQITNIGNVESFELIIARVKEDIIRSVNEEDFKAAKNSMAKINKMRDFTDYIEKQSDIVADKRRELKDLEYKLNNYQLNMFEEDYDSGQNEPVDTDIKRNGKTLRTGDIYKVSEKDEYFLVVCSKDMDGKFALVANTSREEHLLQYPKNQELLNNAFYIGNVYATGAPKSAQDAYKLIQDNWNKED